MESDWEITEEGSYGDVIHFECVSNDKKIDRSSDIHCTETGEWSHPVPKCKGSLHCLFVCLFVCLYHSICITDDNDHRFLSFIQNTYLTIPLSLAFHTEITCTEPDISNGEVVEKMQEYQKDAILKYRCSPGFKPREGIPRCAEFDSEPIMWMHQCCIINN